MQSGTFKAAVLLAGCGVYDGSEITETTAMLVALSKHKAEVQCFAPNRDQMHVVNHLNGEDMKEARNVMTESARIARGNVKAISELKVADFDVLFLPGGFGAAKNWSDFGVKGAEMSVQEDVASVLKDFHGAKKYIGMSCIAPVVAAKVFGSKYGGPGIKLTLGCRGDNWPYNGAIDAATSFGNTLEEIDINGVCHDETNKIVTGPAYMRGDASFGQVYQNIHQIVHTVAQSVTSDLSKPFTMLVSVEIKEDRLAEFVPIINFDAEASRLEPGCYNFTVLSDPENKCKFTFYESYKDQAAVDYHKSCAHYKAWADFKASGGVVSQSVQKLSGFNFQF